MQLSRKYVVLVAALIVLVGISLAGIHGLWRRSVTSWTAKESAYTLPATVMTVSAMDKKGPAEDATNLKVCFRIDNFDSLPPEFRKEYETAERDRYQRHGARCRIVQETSDLPVIGKGDNFSVVMTLENRGAMAPQRFIVNGREIFWKAPKIVNEELLDSSEEH